MGATSPHESKRILYGRRKGRPLRPQQRRLFESLFPQIEVRTPTESGEKGMLDIDDLFGRAMSDLWLEVGFGAGEHLIAQAGRFPDIGFIGAEPYMSGLARTLTVIDAEKIDNIRLFRDDARVLLPHLPDRSAGRAFILFPDPWPKVRHHRRRFVALPQLRELARVLRPGAELRLATDHVGYLAWMLENVRASGAFNWPVSGPSDWRRRPDDWPETRYESKAVLAGRPCAYLRFIRDEQRP